MILEKSNFRRVPVFNPNQRNLSGFNGWPKMRGLGGLFQSNPNVDIYGNPIIDPATGAQTTDSTVIGDLVTRGVALLNAQQVFQLNLDRLSKGLPPIPTQYAAPTLNLGVAGISPQMLMLAAAAVVLLVVLKKR